MSRRRNRAVTIGAFRIDVSKALRDPNTTQLHISRGVAAAAGLPPDPVTGGWVLIPADPPGLVMLGVVGGRFFMWSDAEGAVWAQPRMERITGGR